MFQQKGEINFLLSDMENVDIDSLTKLAIVKAIVTSDPYEFIIAVGKIEPFVIDEEDEEDYNKFVREKKRKRCDACSSHIINTINACGGPSEWRGRGAAYSEYS